MVILNKDLLLKILSDSVFVINKSGDILSFSDFCDKNSNYKDLFIGKNIDDLSSKKIKKLFKTFIEDGEIGRVSEAKFNIENGDENIEFYFKSTPLFQVEFSGIVVVSKEITSLKNSKESVEKFKVHYNYNPLPTITIDKKGDNLIVADTNPALIELTSEKITPYIGKNIEQFFQYSNEILVDIKNCFKSKKVFSRESFFRTPNSENSWIVIATYVYISPDSIMVHFEDITALKKLQESLKFNDLVFNNTNDAIAILDDNGDILQINLAFEVITGYKKEEILNKSYKTIFSDTETEDIYKEVVNILKKEGNWSGEIWNRRKNGEIYPSWLSLNVVINGDEKKVIAILSDLSDLKIKEAKIYQQTYYDTLTGLPNRMLFMEQLKISIGKAKLSKKMVAVLFLDIDHFKKINDSLGHIVGDNLLKEISNRLLSCVRDDDVVSRVGGDEFMILFPELTNSKGVITIAERIINVFQKPVVLKNYELFVTPSMGISLFPKDGKNEVELVKNSDIAMYSAKQKGRNSFQFFSKEMNLHVDQQLTLENQLRKGIERGEFILYYQPIIDIKTGRIVAAEALIRWISPELGMVSPAQFIPLAEETGLIVSIGEWVLYEACKQNKMWQDKGYSPIVISVNTTSFDFQNYQILKTVDRVLKEIQLSPKYITLEITENSLMQNKKEIISVMNSLKEMGIKISIDDFGTGYSSLSYLKRFPLDNLKIDRSFVIDLPNDPDSVSIANAVIALAKSLKLKVIAEGVETQEQLNFLNENSCDKLQGYLISHPLPADQFEELLKTQTI